MPGQGAEEKKRRREEEKTELSTLNSQLSTLLVSQPDQSVEKVEELKARSVAEKPKSAYVFDLGQNMVGWARIKVKAEAGTVIRVRFAEMLNPDGTIYTTNLRGAKATDYYTCRGGGSVETWEPSFTFHGFRYVELTGLASKPGLDAVTGVVITSATPPVGTFACSSPLVNQLQHNIVWGQLGNYLEVPTDCPQRDERFGMDGATRRFFVRTATYNSDIAAFMTKWTQDVVDAQSPDGGFSDVTPRMGDPGGRRSRLGRRGDYRTLDDLSLLRRHAAGGRALPGHAKVDRIYPLGQPGFHLAQTGQQQFRRLAQCAVGHAPRKFWRPRTSRMTRN